MLAFSTFKGYGQLLSLSLSLSLSLCAKLHWIFVHQFLSKTQKLVMLEP